MIGYALYVMDCCVKIKKLLVTNKSNGMLRHIVFGKQLNQNLNFKVTDSCKSKFFSFAILLAKERKRIINIVAKHGYMEKNLKFIPRVPL